MTDLRALSLSVGCVLTASTSAPIGCSRRARWLPSSCAFVLALMLAAALLTGCGTQARPRRPDSETVKAERMLGRYDLHPIGKPRISTLQLETSTSPVGSFFFEQMAEASKPIGLDLQEFRGTKVRRLSYLLKERSQANQPIRAMFLCKDGRVIGAFMVLEGYCGGPTPLNDKRQFAVPGLRPDNLVFKGVKKVDVMGPWVEKGGDPWSKHAVLQDRPAIDRILSLLARSTRGKGGVSGTAEDEEYLLVLSYTGGQEIRARLTTKAQGSPIILTFDLEGFESWVYTPAPELKPYVTRLVK